MDRGTFCKRRPGQVGVIYRVSALRVAVVARTPIELNKKNSLKKNCYFMSKTNQHNNFTEVDYIIRRIKVFEEAFGLLVSIN